MAPMMMVIWNFKDGHQRDETVASMEKKIHKEAVKTPLP